MVGAPQLAQPMIDRMKQVAPAWTLRAAEEARSEIDAGSGALDDGKEVLVGAATERALRDALPRAGAFISRRRSGSTPRARSSRRSC